MSRRACCEKLGLRKGPWRPEEDKKLIAHVEQHGYGNWRSLPARAGLRRCGKSCRLRWINYLKPDIKRGNFSMEEDRTIIHLHALLGNKWSVIAAHLPKRTDNEIKNYWNSHIKKRLIRMGLDPNTHTPMKAIKASNNNNNNNNNDNNNNNNVRHMAQWESVRLEAEARSSSMLMQQQQQIIGTATAGSYSSYSSLIISRIPTKNNNMCAIVLIANSSSSSTTTSTNDDLQSPVSTLSSPGIREHFTGELLTSLSSYQGTTTSTDDHSNSNIINNNNNIIEESGGHVSNLLQDDDELMVAVEAFRSAARCESAMEGRL